MSNTLPSTSNSMTQFLTQLLRIQKNSMEIIGKLSEITSSNVDSVFINQEDVNGVVQSYELPSIGSIKNDIARIDKNFNSISGLDGTNVTVRMPDGSFKKIIQSTLFKQPQKIGSLSVPSSFNKKNNWFFESFLNPLLYVSFDISKYVEYNTQQISYKRVIVNCDTDEKKLFFDKNVKGKNDIDHDSFLNDLYNRQITYFIDEDISNLPVSISRFSGTFDVISYSDETVPLTQPNGTIVQSKVRKFKINTLKYTDNLQNFKNTQILKPGDKIDVGQATRYEIVNVDTSNNVVVLKMTSGTETIPIGVDVLKIAVDPFSIKEAQINVGFDEREVIFIKAIDKDTNITTRDFSPGVAFYSNELLITTSNGSMTLESFYKQEVMDFGSSMLSLTKEGTIPAIYGLKPDPPRLTESNFNVVLVNAQKFDTDVINNLKKKISQKNTTGSEITQIESSIDKKKQELNISKFNSDTERRAVQNQLETLIREKSSKSNLYASIIKDLSTTAKNLPPELSSPVYRVRAFFPIPQPKPSVKTLDQEVVAFIISHRYLRMDGTATGTDQYDFTDNNGETVRGYFSNWENHETSIRKKVYNDSLGIYTWADENVQDANVVNINQIDIPISKGEKVEIRVKSLSEAGWPSNPQESEWSNSVIIPFPDTLSMDEEVLSSLASALNEESRVNFNQDLAAMGLDIHLETSVLKNDKYYAHSSDVIFSGFYDGLGNAIDMYNKIKDMDTQIASLKAMIEKAKGKLQVFIVDPNGEKYIVANNSTVDLMSGYYSNIVATLPAANQKGAIITSVYKLVIENAAVSALQLVSSFPGGLDMGLPVSSTSVDADYSRSKRYDIVPLSLASMSANKTANSKSYQSPPFQSAQQLSQYLYMRYTDIGLKTPLYGNEAGIGGNIENNTLYPKMPGAGINSFIWNYTYTGTVPNGFYADDTFVIHILHPDINNNLGLTLADLNRPASASTTSPSVYPKIIHSSFFNKQSFETNGTVQTQYFPTDVTTVSLENYPIKLGFYENDRYLIGSDTCGSYLYVAPSSYSDILVDGADYRAVRNLEFGETNQISIPIIFQYRMTDFWGNGTSGLGRIGGFSVQPTNLIYSKKIGFDIATKDDTLFSFDVKITAKYKIDSPSQTSISPAQNSKLDSKQTEFIKQIF